jgi:thiamine biosynthesis lipoprotein
MTAVFPRQLGTFLRRLQNRRQATVFSFYQENVLGTSFEFRVRTRSQETAEHAEVIALAEIDRLEKIFSSFSPASEFRQWQAERGSETVISPELMALLLECDYWREKSKGAFTPFGEALAQLWKRSAEKNQLPSADELSLYTRQAARPLWKLNPKERTATCLTEYPLTLNAIAKGYIVDKAFTAAFASAEDIFGLTLNLGGDLRMFSDQEEIIGVADPDNDAENAPPFSRIRLQQGAMATSGDWRRGFQIDETFYSHILDPRSGKPVESIRSASVFAPTTADTDALATIFSILTPEESLSLADSLPGTGCLLIARDGQVWRSAEWRKREIDVSE